MVSSHPIPTYLTERPQKNPNTFPESFEKVTPPIKTNRFPQTHMQCVAYNNPPPPDV